MFDSVNLEKRFDCMLNTYMTLLQPELWSASPNMLLHPTEPGAVAHQCVLVDSRGREPTNVEQWLEGHDRQQEFKSLWTLRDTCYSRLA